MKPHLPKKLLVAVLAACSMGLTAKAETAATSYTLGDVMYVGDSITHGLGSASYRWALHKILVDNGVYYNEVGYTKGNTGYTIPDSNYRGVVFENAHCAMSSQRTFNTAGRVDTARLGHSSIQNWLGVSTVEDVDPKLTMNDVAYTGPVFNPDTFVMMLGTNDLISEPSGSSDVLPTYIEERKDALLGAADTEGRRTGGDMGTIVDTMYASNSNAKVYVSSVPCWTASGNNNGAPTHAAVQSYNESLEQWVADYNAENGTNIKFVNVNRGLMDVRGRQDVSPTVPFYGVSSMFNNADDDGTDGLHPNSQGDLLIAGNMARAMGYGGRTAGLARKAAGEASFQTTLTGNLLGEHAWESVATGGFTTELMGFTIGNGETDGWNITDNFSITLGNGSVSGTLDINEAYIQWNGQVSFSTGSTVLFSEDMSGLTENIRIAYHTGDTANNIASGFYVWLGDMLIGEALQGSASSVNGVTLSYSGTGSYTLAALSMDATAAYAPTTTLASAPRVAAPDATAQGVVTVPTVADKDSITIQSAADGSNAMSGVSTTNADDTKVATVSFASTTTLNTYFANSGNRTVKDIYVTINNGQINKGWFAAHTSGTLTGNSTLIVAGDFEGSKPFVSGSTGGSVFGVLNGTVDGNITLQFDAASAEYSSFTETGAASVQGAFQGSISGVFKAVINAGTFNNDIVGGVYNGNSYTGEGKSIGSTQIYVNGGLVKGAVYGGGGGGEILGDTLVSINGGALEKAVYGGGRGDTIQGNTHVILNGGSIGGNIYGGGTAGTINRNTSVTIDGNLVALGGSVISGGGSGGAIIGHSTVTIKNASASNYIRSIDQFAGTITGGSNVSDTSTLVFENSVLDSCLFADNVQVEEFDTISLKNSSIGVGSASMTGTTSSISLTGDSTLTVNNDFTSVGGLDIVGGSGSVVFAGAKNDILGQLSIAAGNEFVLQTGSSVKVKNAIVNDGTLSLHGTVNFQFDSVDGFVYSYNPAEINRPKNGLGSALVEGEFITGSGTLANTGMVSATINENAAQINTATGQVIMENFAYYVMETPEVTNPKALYYSYGNGKYVPVDSIVTVGTHDDARGPVVKTEANSAQALYIGKNGTLCIVGDSETMSVAEIMTTTHGSGDMILRSPGYGEAEAVQPISLAGKTHVTGDLYITPYVAELKDDESQTHIVKQTGPSIILEQGADISSFNSINLNHSYTYLAINGEISRGDEERGHINNLTNSGAGFTYFIVNQGANKDILLSGDTMIRSYTHADAEAIQPGSDVTYGGEQPSWLCTIFNTSSNVTIENLTSRGDADLSNFYYNRLDIQTSYVAGREQKDPGFEFSYDEVIDGVVNIDSFEFNGQISLSANQPGSLHVNLNLLKEQTLLDYQYFRSDRAMGSQSLTITGEGTYILTKGMSIKDNFGVLSTEKIGDKQVWRGTVEVNQLVANQAWDTGAPGKNGINFADYGNDQSTIHFKGFNGYVFNTTDGKAYENVTIGQDLILTNPDADTLVKDDNGNPVAPHAFQLSNGFSDQQLHFTGDISGTGDFVVSTGASEKIFFKGDVSEWKDGAEFKVTNGTQSVTFQDNATEVNAALVTAGGALNLTVSTAEGTTFTNEVNVSSLSVSADSTALFEKGATAGDVSVGLYKGAAAEVSNGMTIATTTENNITSTSISGGKAVNVDFVFDADKNNTVRNATLSNVRISSVSGSSVLLEELSATNVYLHGEEVNFSALEVENSFYLVAATEDHNEVRFESDAFAGMTLSEEGLNTITLTVNNAVNWGEVSNENPNSVTIVLKGFTMEGLVRDVQVDGWLSNLIISGDETSASLLTLNAEQSATGTGMSVNELLAAHYDYVTYEQKADGLHIRMSNIPEPTTGTLSLLALAAIAARRRRK